MKDNIKLYLGGSRFLALGDTIYEMDSMVLENGLPVVYYKIADISVDTMQSIKIPVIPFDKIKDWE